VVLQIVEVGDTGVAGSVGYGNPVATTNAVYWFPTSAGGGDVIKYNATTNTITTIATGVAHGWAGAIQANDGLIYATPTVTHDTILRITPSTDAVATANHGSSPLRPFGVPSAVTVGGADRVYAGAVGVHGASGRHSDWLRINCSAFTVSVFAGTSPANVSRFNGDSIAHPNGLIYWSPKDQVSGYSVLALDPTTDTFTQIGVPGTGARELSAMCIAGTSSTSPIYLGRTNASAGGTIYKLTVTGTPAITRITTGPTLELNASDTTYGRRPLILMSSGNMIGAGTDTSDNALLVTTSTDVVSTITLSGDKGYTSGGVLAGNSKAYFFSNADDTAAEIDAAGTVTYISPDTADARAWGEPVNIAGNVYILSTGTGGFTRRVGRIRLATGGRRGLGLVR
jgi:hypothetical protein